MIKRKMIFIILHYIVHDVTIKSVEYIEKNIDISDYQIIIVDNASPNDSYEILKNKFENDEQVLLIRNKENLGFTRGNNVGIKYALECYKFEYLVLLNNDAFLLETALYSKLNKYNQKYEFAVAGPRIIDIYGNHSNPMAAELPTIQKIDEIISVSKKIVKYHSWHLLRLYCFYMKYRRKLERINKILRSKEKHIPVVNDVKENVVLHGSFWIFTPRYFQYYKGLPEKKGTYIEEETLLFKIKQEHLKSVYLPDVLVLHLDDVATDVVYHKSLDKVLYVNKQTIISWEEYKKMVMEENERKKK